MRAGGCAPRPPAHRQLLCGYRADRQLLYEYGALVVLVISYYILGILSCQGGSLELCIGGFL